MGNGICAMSGLYTSEGVIDRKELWEKYGALVRSEALKLQVRLPASVELDDLIQAGAMGLLAAVDDFDASKGISISKYITQRVRWALIDELRERDWVPRRVRTNAREIAQVIHKVEQQKGEAATEAEIAAAMNVSLRDYQQMLVDTNTSQIFSLDELQELVADSFENPDEQHEALNPLNQLEINRLVTRIANEITHLPEREQMLLNLYYQQELNMKEIGLLLNITETRVSQLHSQAIKRVRARLESSASSNNAMP